jgi:hypothetical protein
MYPVPERLLRRDGDLRASVLINPPVWLADHFGNQAFGTPIDCEAISFLPARRCRRDPYVLRLLRPPLPLAKSANLYVHALRGRTGRSIDDQTEAFIEKIRVGGTA